ncbi:E3 ubiquitin-protein ligase BRE1-like 1 [Striga asiatica]|uniref:E3 ubiquitin-protein ligase BRE1-like 1 n=1 Tax=Striga asiatica TaxID=4170 RepID=A0A5A7PE09_STRAF|nr:E3 ubiquitin-protein ligase BRE1-like 1 [Striga asiatica]
MTESSMALRLLLRMVSLFAGSVISHGSSSDAFISCHVVVEIKAWAHVQSLNSSLDEQNLDLRVKIAIEAEAKAQQTLAASEAGIAELRQKLEASKRFFSLVNVY